MSLQIIILKTDSQNGGSFSVSGVFWLMVQSNNVVPLPTFKSQIPFIDAANLQELRDGTLVEQSFNSGLFASETTIEEVQVILQDKFNEAQEALFNTTSPLENFIGNVFDGYIWSDSNPFTQTNNISISSQFTKRTFIWSIFKALNSVKMGQIQFYESVVNYTIWFYDYPEVYVCNIWKNNVPDSQIQAGYTQEQNDLDKSDFESTFKNTANKPINKIDAAGRNIIVDEPRSGSETIYASSNFCDKCSWYSGSIRVNDEVLTDAGDGFRFNTVNLHIIDMVSGRVLDDDGLIAEQQELNPDDPHGYQTIVNVDGDVKTARLPFIGSGGDYEVFYDDGYIQFFESQAGKAVTASYSYASSSIFILKPLPGKYLDIEAAESDFSSDVVFNDALFYTVYGYVDVFAPQLMPDIPSGTLIPLQTSKYKRYTQILREAVGAFPTLPPNGATQEHYNLDYKEFRRQSRGAKMSSLSVPFRYATVRKLSSAAGMELRVGLENDQVFDGETSTITFYCTSKDE